MKKLRIKREREKERERKNERGEKGGKERFC